MSEALPWLISVDDHIIEPPRVWIDRLPSRDREAAPRVIEDAGGQAWIYEGRRYPTWGVMTVAGKPREESAWIR